VSLDAKKPEIKAAVEQLFNVKVANVRTTTMKGKTKRQGARRGKRSDWKKAYVSLEQGHEIDLASIGG
jgi:large subunit ribosomal protein L23